MSMPAEYMPFGAKYAQLSKKQRYMMQKTALWSERDSWDIIWKQISKLFQPRAGRFTLSDRNKGQDRHNEIYDSTGLRARRILAAGLMSGLTSPARPWFKLVLPDRKLMENQNVSMWLHVVTGIMSDIFRSSNTYRALPTLYNELAGFGIGASYLEDDFDDVIRHYPTTIGEYAIAQNARGKVDTIYRAFQMPAIAIVRKFGIENCSRQLKASMEAGQFFQWYPVIHVVQPREDGERERGNPLPQHMPFVSCWFEPDVDMSGENQNKVLRESGYKRFPALVPRWMQTGGDIYGDSPGMEALGDAKQLMHEQFRKAQAIDYQTNPPLQVPTIYKDQEVERFPGGIIYTDPASPTNQVKSAFDVNLRLDYLLADIEDARTRINQAFYVDLFMMMANIDKSNVTAREIAEKHEEKLLMLGPVLERLDDELLEPLVDFTFQRMVETKVMPPPPRELQGMQINIEFIGVLAQAQRAVGIAAVDRMLATITAVAQIRPEVVDKLNADQVVDAYAEMLSVPPDLIVSDDDVAQTREERAQVQRQQMAVEQAKPMADTMKTMSETDPNKTSVLSTMSNPMAGQGAL